MEQIRLGTIGSGLIVRLVLKNVVETEGIRLTAVYSRSAGTGAALAEEFGGARVYTDMEAFLADAEVNFVYVASPNSLHYEQAKRALLAGKNVICEKPFCPRAEQARELVAIAREKGLYLFDAVPPSFMPNLEIVKGLLPRIGKLRLVMSNFSQYSSRYDRFLAGETPNIFNPAFAGGCLMDINFYNVYLNVALFGKPRQAVYYPNMHRGIDTSGVLVMGYDGFVSQACGAKDTWGVNFFQIEGEEGHIYIKDGSAGLTQVRLVTRDGEEVFSEQSSADRWLYEVQEITRLVHRDDREEMERRLDVMLDVIGTMETARKNAGILFPGD